jgi:hypothetical protein
LGGCCAPSRMDMEVGQHSSNNVLELCTPGQHPGKLAPLSELRVFQHDHSVVFSKADKGGAVVVVSVADFRRGLDAFLLEPQHYSITKQSTNKCYTAYKKFVAKLQADDILTTNAHYFLNKVDKALPCIHGLPKVHKPGVPLRPIVSLKGSMYEHMTSYVARRLEAFLDDPDSPLLSSGVLFRQGMAGTKLTASETIVSFDVVSLYPSISHQLARETVGGLDPILFLEVTGCPLSTITTMLEFLLDVAYVSDGGTVYQQTSGLPMGSAISGPIAQLVMRSVDRFVADNAPKWGARRWYRYIDDCFVIVQRDLVAPMLHDLHSIHPDLRFTVEHIGDDDTLLFLDVAVLRRPDGVLDYTVGRKPCAVFDPPQVSSLNDYSLLRKSIFNMALRAHRLCSTRALLDAELQFLLSGYTSRAGCAAGAVLDVFAAAAHRYFNPPVRPPRARRLVGDEAAPRMPQPPRYAVLPFLPDPVQRRTLQRLLRSSFNASALFLNRSNLQSAFRRVAVRDRRYVDPCVYAVKCTACPDTGYVGETGRSFALRRTEHQADIRNHLEARDALANGEPPPPRHLPPKSALVKHMLRPGHEPDWAGSGPIPPRGRLASDLRSRKVVESVIIATSPSAWNDRVSSDSIFAYLTPSNPRIHPPVPAP